MTQSSGGESSTGSSQPVGDDAKAAEVVEPSVALSEVCCGDMVVANTMRVGSAANYNTPSSCVCAKLKFFFFFHVLSFL